ncbi:acyl-CoA dehydrogenase [Sciscionella sediminilitoris]|uniref:acyl-CoA dehydrogenase n=1 Tax=Sciscionella sediminilitoris TaxID=1445613 RepID=UPI000AE77CC6|nr:acyl-CoA dehydrogenase [Sciscionella sp. SE31]
MTTIEETDTSQLATAAFEPIADEALRQCGHPGTGSPGQRMRRWQYLYEIGARNLDLARLAEAHVDAATINGELGGPAVKPGQYWGVWAADPPTSFVEGIRDGHGIWRLVGTKQWCSGATVYTHALITAHCPDGVRLFAVDCADAGVEPGPPSWQGVGMAGSDTRTVTLHDVPATPVGEPGAYLDRPGFWFGAISVAACWLGGAAGIAGPLYRAQGADALDDHGKAHLGAVDAALAASRWALSAAASEPWDDLAAAQLRALRVRAIVENTAQVSIDHVGRALGPGPLATDTEHSRRIADLLTYVRQSHAERDLAALARLLDEPDLGW